MPPRRLLQARRLRGQRRSAGGGAAEGVGGAGAGGGGGGGAGVDEVADVLGVGWGVGWGYLGESVDGARGGRREGGEGEGAVGIEKLEAGGGS